MSCPLHCKEWFTVFAFGCNNKDGDCKRGVHFHHLPLRNKPLLKQWLTKIWLQNPSVRRSSLVCSEHFEADCFQRDLQAELLETKSQIHLKLDAVPTILLSPSNANNDQQDRNEDTIRLLFTVCFNQPVT